MRKSKTFHHLVRGLVIVFSGIWLTSCQTVRRAETEPKASVAPQLSALDRSLASAQSAWQSIERASRKSDAYRAALTAYQLALTQVLEDLHRLRPEAPWREPITTSLFSLNFDSGSKNTPLRRLDFMSKAEALSPGLQNVKEIGARDFHGLGLPVNLLRRRPPAPTGEMRYLPLNGRWLPATFVIDFTRPQQPVARFYNSRYTLDVTLGSRRHRLAYDYSSPLDRSLPQGFYLWSTIRGFILPEKEQAHEGLFLTETYDERKIPVIFIHGLGSNPLIWKPAMHELLADPQLRERYQIMYFFYPTGEPILASAANLRKAINAARREFDPHGKHRVWLRSVLVGHSMGGILARIQSIDSGSEMWRTYFTKPPDQLPLSSERQQMLNEAFYFTKNPAVSRAIFIATPHRGSELAEWKILSPIRGLIKLPIRIKKNISDLVRFDESLINPELKRFNDYGTRSVDNLSPNHPVLRLVGARHIQVPHHSIMADVRLDDAKVSDGVVPYESSHLDSAQSEKIVQGRHSCTGSAEVVAEILRVLRLHH